MDSPALRPEIEEALRRALSECWSEKTSVCFNPGIAPRSYGQCAPTAIVIFETFGGEILRTTALNAHGREVRHFYNRIGSTRYDFTASQFEIPNYWTHFAYDDHPSSVEEAMTETLPGQVDAMRRAWRSAWTTRGDAV